MSTFNPRTFTSLGLLKAIKPDLLIRFFAPHRAYLESLGAAIPESADSGAFDCARLHAALTNADAPPPPDALGDAMAVIDEMANEDGADALEDALLVENPAFVRPENIEPADFALLVWLDKPEIVEAVNARRFAFESRSFLSFKLDADVELPPAEKPTPEHASRVRAELARRFDHIYPADSFRVIAYGDPEGSRYLVRHGGPLVREGIVDPKEPAKSDSVLYRRELFDLVLFVPAARELRIHARSKRDCDIYTRAFGACLIGDDDAFPDSNKYTLQPLIDKGREALACAHIRGLKEIKLTEFTINLGGALKESLTRRATDLFATKTIAQHGIRKFGNLIRARFEVQFAGANKPRTISIIVPNKAKYKRDRDGSLIERWLDDAGFIVRPDGPDDPESRARDADAVPAS